MYGLKTVLMLLFMAAVLPYGMSDMSSIIFDFDEIKHHLERLTKEREAAEAEVLAQSDKPDLPAPTKEDGSVFTFMIPIDLYRGIGGSN
jgi:hypothetical protein